MAQINSKLRTIENGHFAHYCPGCEEVHIIPKGWDFNGHLESPTIHPSLKITVLTKKLRFDMRRDRVIDDEGNAIDFCCHYRLIDGVIYYQSDCTHEFKSKSVHLPDLPEWLCDD